MSSAAGGDVAAIVLTGGGSRRLGGVHKPALPIGGRPMIARVLDAVGGIPVVVVGAAEGVYDGVPVVSESPPGGGPVAAIAEGRQQLSDQVRVCVVLAADQPFLTHQHIGALVDSLAGHALATYVDSTGHPQWLCAAWDIAELDRRLRDTRSEQDGWRGLSLRLLAEGVRRVDVPDPAAATTDVDTPEDLRRARLRWRNG